MDGDEKGKREIENEITKLKEGVGCPVHIFTMETSHKSVFFHSQKFWKTAPLLSEQENCNS